MEGDRKYRTLGLLVMTLVELGLALYLLGSIVPAVADLGPVTISAPTTTVAPGASTSISTPSPSTSTPPTTIGATETVTKPIRPVFFFGIDWKHPSAELMDLLLVILLAAIGASIHCLTSLTTFVGNRRFVSSWTAWYVARLPVGVAIGVLFYVVVRAGFVTVGSGASSINPFGLAAGGGLAGMFSKQATDKLRDIFDTAFNTSGDAQRKDKADASMGIDHATPASVPVGTADRTIQLHGQGFFAATAAKVGSDSRPVTAQDPTWVAVTLSEADVAKPGVVTIDLVGPGPKPAPTASIGVRVRPQVNAIQATDEHDRSPRVVGVGFTSGTDVYIGDTKAKISSRSADDATITIAVSEDQFNRRAALHLHVANKAKEGGDSDPVALSTVTNWPPPPPPG